LYEAIPILRNGAGAFVNATLSNGQPLVKGKRIAGFPNSTEKEKDWAKQGSLLPFLVEERLKEKGAITVNKDNISDKHDVIIDDRIVFDHVPAVCGTGSERNAYLA
jgi:putative intracellular protease/amidase